MDPVGRSMSSAFGSQRPSASVIGLKPAVGLCRRRHLDSNVTELEQRANDRAARLRRNTSTCSRSLPSMPCAPRSNGSKAVQSARDRRSRSGSPTSMRVYLAADWRLAHFMRSRAAAMAPSMARRPPCSAQGSPRARGARSSGASRGPTCSRRRSPRRGSSRTE